MSPVKNIDAVELQRLQRSGPLVVVDVRTAPEVAHGMIEGARAAEAGERIAIVQAAPQGLAVRARRESVEQVMSILVANAVEAIGRDRGGRIDIGAERVGDTVRLSVRDDGAGMSAEVLRRAFDPFFTTKAGGSGAGLGLAVARGIVEANGGRLWLESRPGAGATAVVELPDAIEAGSPEA
jgi:signal transduction histidine kinase